MLSTPSVAALPAISRSRTQLLAFTEGEDEVVISAPVLTADRSLVIPDTSGTIVTTGDSGTVTSEMILNGTIVDADINLDADIAVSKLAPGGAYQLLGLTLPAPVWSSPIPGGIPGTLDVPAVIATTFDGSVTAGTLEVIWSVLSLVLPMV